MDGVIETMSAQATVERLRGLGLHLSHKTLCAGIKQGAYPFGEVVETDTSTRCTIYTRLLDEWIAARITERR